MYDSRKQKKKKVLVMALSMAVVGLLPTVGVAQGMFGTQYEAQNQTGSQGLFGRGGSGGYNLITEQFGSNVNGGYEINTEPFGQESPMGSGLFLMAAAGAAYALKKRKKNN